MWSHDFEGDLGKRKTSESPTYISSVTVGGGRGAGRWNMIADVAERKDWDALKRWGRNTKWEKKLWRRSHTSCSQDLSPWQLSPPVSARTNWNCVCLWLSISFISCLKVNVPLNEITHSVNAPTQSLISSSFGQTWNRSTYFMKLPTQTLLTLDCNVPLGHNQIYLVRSGSVSAARHDMIAKC